MCRRKRKVSYIKYYIVHEYSRDWLKYVRFAGLYYLRLRECIPDTMRFTNNLLITGKNDIMHKIKNKE